MSDNLYRQVRTSGELHRAWHKVRDNGRRSKSARTRAEVATFATRDETELRRIAHHLLRDKYCFEESIGVAQKRPGKTARPIVIAPIRDRVVQRAILQTLQGHEPLKQIAASANSFGGIEDKSVRLALVAFDQAVKGGAKFYVRSDIQSFFNKIPKSEVMARVREVVDDDPFLALFDAALRTDLANLAELAPEDRELFPLDDEGVAQGSSLSPLAGNILLNGFDNEMNSGDVVCLRYIDDFVLLGPSQRAVDAAFRRARRHLAQFGLEAYEPGSSGAKAKRGMTDRTVSFLGCDIRPGMIQPGRAAKLRLFASIREVFDISAARMSSDPKNCVHRDSLIDSLVTVSNVLKGWGNQYAFCNNVAMMEEIDRQVDTLIGDHIKRYRQVVRALDRRDDRRRVLGVHLLRDSKRDPIIQVTSSEAAVPFKRLSPC